MLGSILIRLKDTILGEHRLIPAIFIFKLVLLYVNFIIILKTVRNLGLSGGRFIFICEYDGFTSLVSRYATILGAAWGGKWINGSFLNYKTIVNYFIGLFLE
jgi:hypothetical protein